MSIELIKGNLFASFCQTLVNPVNCAGAMGAGLAREFKLRFPEMFQEYRSVCRRGGLDIGVLWIYRTDARWILNFPTKKHWRGAGHEDHLHAGLKTFMDSYRTEGIVSVAFPLLGAGLGGLKPHRSLEIMRAYLTHCTIPVEIYLHDWRNTILKNQ